MRQKGQAIKVYEARVIEDALTRLKKSSVPAVTFFSPEELKTFAKRARESFRSRNTEPLDKYAAQLVKSYGVERVAAVSAELVRINNAIGYEEK